MTPTSWSTDREIANEIDLLWGDTDNDLLLYDDTTNQLLVTDWNMTTWTERTTI